MSFLNRKETVYDLQLTQYGKYLYSKGKLKPSYYAFFDDDIIYDGLYAGIPENKNNIETRIQEETPYLKCQSVLEGIETNLNSQYTEKENNFYSESEIYSLAFPLGNSDLFTEKVPSWNINLLKGNILNFTPYVSSSQSRINIPQISTSVQYDIKSVKFDIGTPFDVGNITNPATLTEDQLIILESQFGGSEDPYTNSFLIDNVLNGNYNQIDFFEKRDDGTALYTEEKSIVLSVVEENTQILDDLFEIEVFAKDLDSESNTVWKKLVFFNEKEIIKNNILLDEIPNNQQLTNEYVEYYFNIAIDSEIDNDIVCNYITPTTRGQNTIVNIVRCGFSRTEQIRNLYGNNNNSGDTC